MAGGVISINPITAMLPLDLEGHGVNTKSGLYRAGQIAMLAPDIISGVGAIKGIATGLRGAVTGLRAVGVRQAISAARTNVSQFARGVISKAADQTRAFGARFADETGAIRLPFGNKAPQSAAAGSRGGEDLVEFAHGTRSDYAHSIVDDGVNTQAIKASEFGSAEPGSFFTVKIDPSNPMDALETAAAWGARHGGDTCVVVCRLPRSVVTQLERSGQLVHGRIPYESVFRPGAFDTLNQYRHLWEVLPTR